MFWYSGLMVYLVKRPSTVTSQIVSSCSRTQWSRVCLVATVMSALDAEPPALSSGNLLTRNFTASAVLLVVLTTTWKP